jgi:hypothetical protein
MRKSKKMYTEMRLILETTGLFKRDKEDTTGNLFSLALIAKNKVKGRSLEQCSPLHLLLKTT